MSSVPVQVCIKIPSRSPATRQFTWRANKLLQASPSGGGMYPITATNAQTHWTGSSEEGKSESYVYTGIAIRHAEEGCG